MAERSPIIADMPDVTNTTTTSSIWSEVVSIGEAACPANLTSPASKLEEKASTSLFSHIGDEFSQVSKQTHNVTTSTGRIHNKPLDTGQHNLEYNSDVLATSSETFENPEAGTGDDIEAILAASRYRGNSQTNNGKTLHTGNTRRALGNSMLDNNTSEEFGPYLTNDESISEEGLVFSQSDAAKSATNDESDNKVGQLNHHFGDEDEDSQLNGDLLNNSDIVKLRKSSEDDVPHTETYPSSCSSSDVDADEELDNYLSKKTTEKRNLDKDIFIEIDNKSTNIEHCTSNLNSIIPDKKSIAPLNHGSGDTSVISKSNETKLNELNFHLAFEEDGNMISSVTKRYKELSGCIQDENSSTVEPSTDCNKSIFTVNSNRGEQRNSENSEKAEQNISYNHKTECNYDGSVCELENYLSRNMPQNHLTDVNKSIIVENAENDQSNILYNNKTESNSDANDCALDDYLSRNMPQNHSKDINKSTVEGNDETSQSNILYNHKTERNSDGSDCELNDYLSRNMPQDHLIDINKSIIVEDSESSHSNILYGNKTENNSDVSDCELNDYLSRNMHQNHAKDINKPIIEGGASIKHVDSSSELVNICVNQIPSEDYRVQNSLKNTPKNTSSTPIVNQS